jgi:hypothetical protein
MLTTVTRIFKKNRTQNTQGLSYCILPLNPVSYLPGLTYKTKKTLRIRIITEKEQYPQINFRGS